MLKIQFLGAAQTVTGSKYLLTLGKRHLLVDCGLFQGLKSLRLKNWQPLTVNPRMIDSVLLTHAHIDHSGYLPLLIKNGFRGPVYSTSGTRALCEILLPDAGHIQEEDANFANKHRFSKHKPALPLYTELDGKNSLRHFRSTPWKKKVPLDHLGWFQFLPAGHILGASMIQVMISGTLITFSGDMGRTESVLMKPPEEIKQTDYLVIESTYGDRLHPTELSEETLKKIIDRTIKKGGKVLIPAFAVGRVQEILFLIGKLKAERQIPNVPVYLNSPMAVEATRIVHAFQKEMALTAAESQMICEVAEFITTVDASKRLNSLQTPAIIISASGMATGGRVLHHLKFLAPDPKNAIVFVGYQAAGTRGEAMIRGIDHIKIHGIQVPIRAEVHTIETLSAHADQEGLIQWMEKISRPPKMTFITHGEPLAAEALRKRIEEELHWRCHIPDYREGFHLT